MKIKIKELCKKVLTKVKQMYGVGRGSNVVSSILTVYYAPNWLGTVHPKIKTMSSFTNPHALSNLYDFLSLIEQN